ncbi:MAG TPA: hypothetical protein VLD19_19360, partial [Chitinophagaceae bacterium]|nr:hypothetical protein [Chitinophagaceae bacterium]
LKSYIDNRPGSNVAIRWKSLRDIVPGYSFDEIKYRKGLTGQWVPDTVTIDKWRDKRKYTGFETTFRQVYRDTLNHRELFLTSIVYGISCGAGGAVPEYMQLLEGLLRKNDVAAIRQWLKSPNAEKQLYAVYGYRALRRRGYIPTQEENRLFAIIQQKQGSVSSCSGCTSSGKTFQEMVADIGPVSRK